MLTSVSLHLLLYSMYVQIANCGYLYFKDRVISNEDTYSSSLISKARYHSQPEMNQSSSEDHVDQLTNKSDVHMHGLDQIEPFLTKSTSAVVLNNCTQFPVFESLLNALTNLNNSKICQEDASKAKRLKKVLSGHKLSEIQEDISKDSNPDIPWNEATETMSRMTAVSQDSLTNDDQTNLKSNEHKDAYFSPESILNRLNYYLDVFIQPCLGLCGVPGNIYISTRIARNGFSKRTNILFLALAVSSVLNVFTCINIASIIRWFPKKIHPETYMWEYTEGQHGAARLCFEITRVCLCMSWLGGELFSTICVCCAIERLVTLYFPKQASTLLALVVIKLAVVVALIFWLPQSVMFGLSMVTFTEFLPELQVYTLGFEIIHNPTEAILEKIFDFLSGLLPLVIIFVGMVLLALKLRKRAMEIKSRERDFVPTCTEENSALKITLSVGVTFCITRGLTILPLIYTFDTRAEGIIFWRIMKLMEHISSVTYYIIFVSFNK